LGAPYDAEQYFLELFMLRFQTVFAAVVFTIAPGVLQAQAPQGAPPPVSVAKPIVKDVIEFDDFTGRFEAVDAVEVRARVGGYLEAVPFKDGSIVKKGDLLFVIDRRSYKASLDQAESTLVSAQARLSFAENDLERAENLRKNGNISDQVLDQRRQNFLSAKADSDRLEAGVREARLNYEFTEIRAPIGGRISRKLISEGNLVNANTTLLTTIVSLDPIYFYFDIDERSYLAYQRTFRDGVGRGSGRREGYDVLIGLTDEKDQTRPGRVDFVDNRIDQSTGTIRGRASVPNADIFITPGLFGTIRVPGSLQYKGVLIPDEAIVADQDRRLVWKVAADGSVAAQVVRPGPRIDGFRLIREGLSAEDTIVISGLQRVRPGAKVTPQMVQLPQKR
jgi:membrane fusion protein, multidrug efflux system